MCVLAFVVNKQQSEYTHERLAEEHAAATANLNANSKAQAEESQIPAASN
jgi:hypothetical protein